MSKLPKAFYHRDDVVRIGRELIGKYLYTRIDDQVAGGMIVETEAYRGHEDSASHARGGLRTKRNRIMYQPGGASYVYLCYGIHVLFNVVTNRENQADAVLIRAIQPEQGLKVMLERRKLEAISPQIASGPGLVSQALGIGLRHYGTDLTGDIIWIEEKGVKPEPSRVHAGPRIGIAYAKEHAFYPWRFFLG